ncbi:MAG: trypsin-like peptidase domain-containing protein [Oscillospiraceae bacterium]|nr:trypsin-like peptidase domain-containing protein [Oscillospiraceae bacterium]
MDKHNDYEYDWDDQYYGTGPTKPPKNHGGLIALMLMLLIFLTGIITVLGILNIRMFRELRLQEKETDELSIAFTTEATEPLDTAVATTISEETAAPSTVPDTGFATMSIQPSPQGLDNIPTEGGLSLQDIYTNNIQSVVSITCSGYGTGSTGTGVVLSSDGFIVTNAHVVDDAAQIMVQLTDDRTFEAEIIGADEISDLAVLFIGVGDLIPAQFGDSASLRVGDTVVAIGDPLGAEFRGTYTNGIVSAINRDVDVDGRTMTLIQTNAALNSGNSGGPLINCYGQVIGINTMKIGTFTDTAGVEGLGFAIPSTTVKEIVDQLVQQGYVSGRPTLGLTGETISGVYQHYYRMPPGLYITWVDPNSSAYQRGIEDGDILLSINDNPVTTMDEMRTAIVNYEVGETVEAVIYRAGQRYLVELILTEDRG